MKLVHPDLEGQIILTSDQAFEWIIESPQIFSSYVQEIQGQANGEEGRFVLSEANKEISIEDAAKIVIDPFSLNVNERKIISRLYAELRGIAYGEELYMQTQEMISVVQGYLTRLEQENIHMLAWEDEIDIVSLFKAFDVRLEDYSSDFLERLEQYMKIMAQLMNKKLFVLININSYITPEQKEKFILSAKYQEVALLFIEPMQKDVKKDMTYYIIDKDGCEIFI